MEYKFHNPMNMESNGRGYAIVEECDIRFEKMFSGYRLYFTFQIEPLPRDQRNILILTNWELDIYFISGSEEFLLGRMIDEINYNNFPVDVKDREFSVCKILEITTPDMAKLIDSSHRGDIIFKFASLPRFKDIENIRKSEGRFIIAHSKWLGLINKLGLDRFELISIKIPISSSHLYKPFSDALEKIREAEKQYIKGDWNGAGASSRAAWRTILSAAPQGEKALEYLLSPVIGDSRRKNFAETLIKGLHNIENAAVHLEGNQQKGAPSVNLNPEDALLCIHWYASVLGYLSSINN